MNKNFYSTENTTQCFYKTIFWCRYSLWTSKGFVFWKDKNKVTLLIWSCIICTLCWYWHHYYTIRVSGLALLVMVWVSTWVASLWLWLRLWHRSSADCEEGLRDGRRQWRSPSQWTSDLVRANTEACHNAVVSTEWPEIMWHDEDSMFEASNSGQYSWAAHTLAN